MPERSLLASAPAMPRAALGWAGLALLAAVLALAVALTRPPLPGDPAVTQALEQILLWQSLVPRAVTALLAGAALGLSGALLQQVLRNPIADPSTLGIASGAQLALTIATAYAPVLIAFSREAVALTGGLAAVGIILGLSWRRGLDPITVVLSGMVISLIAAALSATVILAKGEYVLSLFIWGAGSLNQQSWDAVIALAPRLALGFAAALLLLRPLGLLGLDDRSARSLGLALHGARLLVIAVAVWLAATVTAEIGVIGFVGLAAPALARIAGARTPRQILLAAPVIGAIILSLTDSAVQLLGSGTADLAPTGAATALLGGPLLLWLLPRVRMVHRAQAGLPPSAPHRVRRPLTAAIWLAGLAVLLVIVALTLGRGPDGWEIATGAVFSDLLPFRGPRIVAAGMAGAMLGAAGTLMQRLTGNPLAGPEVLGVSAGGGVGLAVTLFLVPVLNPLYLVLGIALGSLAVLLVMLALAARSGFGPERLLLAGIAMGALCMALISTVLAQGDLRAYVLLVWMSGSTNRVGEIEAWTGVIAAAVLIAPLFLFWRWLDILPLGAGSSRSLGLGLTRSRLTLATFGALLTGFASFLIGPLSLIGLIAPHLARLTGFARGNHQLLAAVLIGGATMILADWLSRIAAFPYQVPVGLFAALIGGPYLIWLLSRGDTDG
ncbi:Fe(3+)-hydroxamate ABC transporter permease FhuB [Bosea caraganae]|uniref:Fe(3+)-hydroxamate ABC transporter permease FhuB n=2 Tax=Bosea caraganae TaxID=2763117 RepID=A0A370L8F1_9HYPH|nr:Fe(3+)-hydroxamate ABC transporter permease FhuB [Bosea caraganae]RDJ30546.1 Fe(3+)-hydroxamate ABC transporter permease FhuB [Bosea caraganae]